MASTTMRFGPEWMRKQPASAKPLATSPPPSGTSGGSSLAGTPAPPGTASYSALVTPPVPPVHGKRDIAHPFKYSRDEMLHVYRDLGSYSELPIEVERWEGVVRESAVEPVSLSDFTEMERKLYVTSLNSEIRRRQPSDYVAQGDRSKGGTLNSGLGLMNRRRRGDSNGADHPPLTLPRKTSWSGVSGNLVSPSTASPRTRTSSNSTFGGISNGNETAWGGAKRRATSGQLISDRLDEEEETHEGPDNSESKRGAHASAEASEGAESQRASGQDSSNLHKSMGQDSGGVVNNVTSSMNKLALNHNTEPQSLNQKIVTSGDSAKPTDLAKVEWSYIDPSGAVQGPFPGETMQRWNDQRYFTDDLMMKRTNIDAEFMSLAEIKRRAQGERVFLSPLSSNTPPPPGLGHLAPVPALNSLLHRPGINDAPRQPSPQAYGLSNPMDSFIAAGSTATGSGSPSSSFGSSMARGPLSPDPLAVGNRLQRFASDAALNGHVSAAGSYSSNGSPAMPQPVRHVSNEPQPNSPSSFEAHPNASRQRPEQGWNGSLDIPQLSQPDRFGQLPSSFGNSHLTRDSPHYAVVMGSAPVDPSRSSSLPSHRFYEQPDSLGSPFQHDPRFDGMPRQPALSQLSTSLNHGFEHQVTSTSVTSNFPPQTQERQAVPLSPWEPGQTREASCPRSFEADLPTSNTSFVVSLPQTSTWNGPRTDVDSRQPWAAAQKSLDQNNRDHFTQKPQNLTTANVNLHNEQQGLNDSRNTNVPYVPASPVDTSAHISGDTAAGDTTATGTKAAKEKQASAALSSSANEPPVQPAATKRKGSAALAIPATEKVQPASLVPISQPSTGPQRSAWAGDDSARSKPSVAPMNLRDIQEAEKKKQEARRHAEKEREQRTSRAASAASPAEEVQFTASWGLPTSQVGARSNSAGATKDGSIVSPTATTPAPAWTNAAKPAAKTMKEIQQEEERRKQAAKERETSTTAAKRAAQVPAVKSAAANVQPSGGAWTVVGAGGKPQTAASVAAVRPNATPQTSTPNVQVASSRPAGSHRTASSPVVSKATSSTAKTDEEPSPPSLEFMKWMRESLRGLNSSVQFEDIAQMLLSFPLDPDKATKEIIAETVYSASTTLNGHDFAEEFIKKRKEDAASRPKGVNEQTANGRPVSLADVVKAQPKQPQNDFGTFKVVRKKNKRS